MKKSYEKFKEDLVKAIEEKLSEQQLEGVKCKLDTFDAPDGMKDRLTVSVEGTKMAMSFRLKEMYHDYLPSGMTFEKAVNKTISTIKANIDVCKNNEKSVMDFVSDYDQVKENLYLRLVPCTSPALADAPHKDIGDMALVANIKLDNFMPGRDGVSCVMVRNDLLRIYGISEEQLFTDARENAVEKAPIEVMTLLEMYAKTMGISPEVVRAEMVGNNDKAEEKEAYVISTNDGNLGAAVLAYPNFADIVSNTVGKNVWVIPSSIHELILIPDTGEEKASELDAMVKSTNKTSVSEREFLSDRCYHYDAVEKKLTLGVDYEAYKDKAEGINPADLIKEAEIDNDIDFF